MIKIAKPKGANILVYEYGLRLDSECIGPVFEQIRKARELYNNIIAQIRSVIEQQQAYILNAAGEEAQLLDAEINSLTEQFLAARANNDEIEMKRAAQERHQKRLMLWKMLAVTRKEHKRELQELFLSKIGKNSACITYQERSKAVADGLGWGTAGEILDNALDAFKKTMAKGQAPRFALGSEITQDTLTLQFTEAGGVPSETLLTKEGGDLFFKLDGFAAFGGFGFRLGAAKNKSYATGTLNYNRPIPPKTHIGLARLVRRKIGKDFKYWLQLQVKFPEDAENPSSERKKPLVAIHFGWSKNDDDTRNIAGIAECAEPSMAEVITLPKEIEAMLEQSREAQSRRDLELDAVVPLLKGWTPSSYPEEIEAELNAIKKLPVRYLSQSRLHRFVWMIKHADIAPPEWLEKWRKLDKMNWQETAHVARRARNKRKNFYRELAKRLASQYSTILVEKLDLKDAATVIDDQTGERTDIKKKARSGRVVAALYELDTAIKQAFEKSGGAVLLMEGENTASTCSLCGGSTVPEADVVDSAICTGCGAVLNKKQNGAANAYRLASAVREDLVEDYHLQSREVFLEKQKSQREKLSKMANFRKENRVKMASVE